MENLLVQGIQGLDIVVVLVQHSDHTIQSDIGGQAPHQLPWVVLLDANHVGEKGAVPEPCLMIHHYVPTPALIGDSILEGRQINFHVTSRLLVALAMVLMPGAPWPIRSWWHWGGSWHWTSITLQPTVQWRCGGQSSPKFLLLLAAVLALLCCKVSFMVQLPISMPQHLPAIISTPNPLFLWQCVLIVEAKWWYCRWTQVRTSRSSSFNVSFIDSLGNQPWAFPQIYSIGIELDPLANLTNGSW